MQANGLDVSIEVVVDRVVSINLELVAIVFGLHFVAFLESEVPVHDFPVNDVIKAIKAEQETSTSGVLPAAIYDFKRHLTINKITKLFQTSWGFGVLGFWGFVT